jgi:hypothetical protein
MLERAVLALPALSGNRRNAFVNLLGQVREALLL